MEFDTYVKEQMLNPWQGDDGGEDEEDAAKVMAKMIGSFGTSDNHDTHRSSTCHSLGTTSFL